APTAAQSSSGIGDNFPQIERVSLQDAKAAYDQDQAVFVDVRSGEEYQQGHIPGAVNIPLLDIPNRIGELNPEDWIITY
ncbi:MAG: rhodanese-like domain-containing protein, partial [Anaerolineales bacterium]